MECVSTGRIRTDLEQTVCTVGAYSLYSWMEANLSVGGAPPDIFHCQQVLQPLALCSTILHCQFDTLQLTLITLSLAHQTSSSIASGIIRSMYIGLLHFNYILTHSHLYSKYRLYSTLLIRQKSIRNKLNNRRYKFECYYCR